MITYKARKPFSAVRLPGRLLVTAALLSLLPCLAQSQSFPSPADRDLIRQQQERRLGEQQQRLEQLQRPPAVPPAQPGASSEDTKCFPIQQIEVEGARQLDADTRARQLAPFENRCLKASEIDEALRALTHEYLDRGYVTTRAYLPEQDLSSGKLKIIVIEGVLESLRGTPESGLSARELWMAFPGRAGEHLNLRNVEQLLDQLNRLPSRQATVELEPGEAPGSSRVLIHDTPQKAWRAKLFRHNEGQKSTGEHHLGLGLEWDSPLGLADLLALSASQNLHHKGDRNSRNASFYYSVPWGWWTASYSYYYSQYESPHDTLAGFHFETSGDNNVHDLRLERIVHRDTLGKTAVNVAFNATKTNNYIEDVRLDTSSKQLNEIGVGLNHGRRLGTGFINLDLGWQRGVPYLGGARDRHVQGAGAHAQYNKYTTTLSYLQPFTLVEQSFRAESLVH